MSRESFGSQCSWRYNPLFKAEAFDYKELLKERRALRNEVHRLRRAAYRCTADELRLAYESRCEAFAAELDEVECTLRAFDVLNAV